MPVITLSSDIGLQDFVVGAIKGIIYNNIQTATVTDITHYLPQDNFVQAAYICNNAIHYYPQKSIHLILINVFDADDNNFVITEINNQYIICANNGFASMLQNFNTSNSYVIPIINANNIIAIVNQLVQVIKKIIDGENIAAVGTQGLSIVQKSMLQPMISSNWIEGQILFIDNFENVVINITQQEFEKVRNGRNFKIVFTRNEVVEELSVNYKKIQEGEYLAWFNAAGYLELAINKGNAASLFGLEIYKEKMISTGKAIQNKNFYQSVRIFFE